MKAGPITEEAKSVAGVLLDTFPNLALMSGFYNGEEVAFVVSVQKNDETGEFIMNPLFITVTSTMHDKCLSADGEALS